MMRSSQLEINLEEASFHMYQNDNLTNVLPSPVQYRLFYKHFVPRLQCLLFERSKIFRSLVGQSVSRPLFVSLSLAHLAADSLGNQYNIREKSIPATRHNIVWLTTISYSTTFCADRLLATLLANGVNHTLRQDGLH